MKLLCFHTCVFFAHKNTKRDRACYFEVNNVVKFHNPVLHILQHYIFRSLENHVFQHFCYIYFRLKNSVFILRFKLRSNKYTQQLHVIRHLFPAFLCVANWNLKHICVKIFLSYSLFVFAY